MEITQDELLEQAKISALETGLYKSRLAKAQAMYNALYNRIAEELSKPDDPSSKGEPMDFDFIDQFPAKIDF